MDTTEENTHREAAIQALIAQAPRAHVAFLYGQEALNRAKLYAMVQRDDALLLQQSMQWLKDSWQGAGITHQLWYSALFEGKSQTFGLLCELSQEPKLAFPLVDSLDVLPPELQLWALNVPIARKLWLSNTKIMAVTTGHTVVNGLRMLTHNDEVIELHARLAQQSEHFHTKMRLLINEFGTDALMKNGDILHTIAYYQEPTKKHLRVAATGPQPVYDITRMEQYWPGIEGCLTALAGLGLPARECENQVRKMVSNKQIGKMNDNAQTLNLPAGFAQD